MKQHNDAPAVEWDDTKQRLQNEYKALIEANPEYHLKTVDEIRAHKSRLEKQMFEKQGEQNDWRRKYKLCMSLVSIICTASSTATAATGIWPLLSIPISTLCVGLTYSGYCTYKEVQARNSKYKWYDEMRKAEKVAEALYSLNTLKIEVPEIALPLSATKIVEARPRCGFSAKVSQLVCGLFSRPAPVVHPYMEHEPPILAM